MRRGEGQTVLNERGEGMVAPIRARRLFEADDSRPSGRDMWADHSHGVYAAWNGHQLLMIYFDELDLWVLAEWLINWVPFLTGRIALTDQDTLEAIVDGGMPALTRARIEGKLR